MYRCHVYSCHCSDSHLPIPMSTHGYGRIGPGPDKILHVFQCKEAVGLHSGQGWKGSFLFSIILRQKRISAWRVSLWTSQDWVSTYCTSLNSSFMYASYWFATLTILLGEVLPRLLSEQKTGESLWAVQMQMYVCGQHFHFFHSLEVGDIFQIMEYVQSTLFLCLFHAG